MKGEFIKNYLSYISFVYTLKIELDISKKHKKRKNIKRNRERQAKIIIFLCKKAKLIQQQVYILHSRWLLKGLQ